MCDTHYEIDDIIRIKRQLEDLLKENDNIHLQNAVSEINKYLKLECLHNKVRDYIDINPEASIPIEYCSICFTTF
uniref:Uncharacterized protein n=1 Tax=viral metagenome TaxID=1070528 RepID=A0A6C0B2R8_9ZZZZ